MSNLGGVSLTWGPNQNSGACSTVANPSCWTDLNLDGFMQANELIGTPTASTTRFDPATGILNTVAPVIDPNVQIGRTREIDHRRRSRADAEQAPGWTTSTPLRRGTQTYINGYQPGAPGSTAPSLFTDRQTYTDPITGKPAPYYTMCQGCTIPTGTSISTTSPN